MATSDYTPEMGSLCGEGFPGAVHPLTFIVSPLREGEGRSLLGVIGQPVDGGFRRLVGGHEIPVPPSPSPSPVKGEGNEYFGLMRIK
jgi:hypothetical protein